MPNLQVVILDYPKLTLDSNPSTGAYLADLLKYKQLGFAQTSQDYIVMDKHDMIGTHFAIYDCQNPKDPQLVLAIRNTYEERSKRHGLTLPIESYIDLAGPTARKHLETVRRNEGPLVDCNSWFVNPNYSFKNSGMRLSELAFTVVTLFILRLGKRQMVGATNEKWGASRWITPIGDYPKGLQFTHPEVPDPHMVLLVTNFKSDWIVANFEKYKDLVLGAHEIVPPEVQLRDTADVIDDLINEDQGRAAA